MELLLAGLLLLCAASILALARGKRVALQRSFVSDQLGADLERIASALEQLAGEATARRLMEEKQRASVTLPPVEGEEKHPVSYSMFGR
jgi:hypothetical protein